jgi:hypothetical protein
MTVNLKQTDLNNLSLDDGTSQPEQAEIGRGVTDTDITYIALRNASGTKSYIYPNSGGTGITVSTTKP